MLLAHGPWEMKRNGYKKRMSQPTTAAAIPLCPKNTKRCVSSNETLIMSLRTTESITAISTGLLAIRTPFVQPSDCETQWRTSIVPDSVVSGTTRMSPIMISDPAATCYPSGWGHVIPESRLSFSPGVCPEGWVYNAMAENTFAVSTAFCCNRSASTIFSLPVPLPNPMFRPLYLHKLASQIVQSLTTIIMLQRLLIYEHEVVLTCKGNSIV